MLKRVYPYVILIALCVTGIYAGIKSMDIKQSKNEVQQPNLPIAMRALKKQPQAATLTEPVAEFSKRITKKKFGIYSTPASSPIPNERFTGWHTGVDVEYGDISKTVPVHAITSGTVTYSGWVSGYGGVTLITHQIKASPKTVVYGHLAPSNLLPAGTKVKPDQVIGGLGKAYSNETDGERKHLHFGILSDNRQDFRGYVSTEAQLSDWLNPTDLY